MVTRKIPTTHDPWTCEVNGYKYFYPAGVEMSVPEEVAAIIDTNAGNDPPDPVKDGHEGQFMGYGEKWKDLPPLPTATSTERGMVYKGASVADPAGSAPTAAEFKALLTSLRNAGIIAPLPPVD